MSVPKKTIREAARTLLARLEAYGEWDEGCFYYKKMSASELEDPMLELAAALDEAVLEEVRHG